MICEHLRELERQLTEQGFSERFRGQTWPRDCREWVYFDCYLPTGARETLPLDRCVEYHENSERGEGGFVCAVHHDAVIGHYPGSGVLARNFEPRRTPGYVEPPFSPSQVRDIALRRAQLNGLAASLRELGALLDRDPRIPWGVAPYLDEVDSLLSAGFTQRDLNDLSKRVSWSCSARGGLGEYFPDGEKTWIDELFRAQAHVAKAADELLGRSDRC